MGKISKIQRSKKHKKIKFVDPFYKGERGIERQQNFLNAAPKNEDDQEIPRKVKMMIENKDKFLKIKQKRGNKKKKKHDVMLPGQTRPMAPAPKFVQGKKEKEEAFYNRVENATQKVLLQSKLSDHYGIDILDLEKGDLKKKNKMSNSRKEKLQHKKEKLKQKKQDRQIDKKEASFLKDDIKFGETVSAPPILTAKPRKATQDEPFAKPGKKSLLLKEIIAANSMQSPNTSNQVSQRQIGQSTKRKNLSMAKQLVMDAERQKAIDLYRIIKNKKVKVS